MSIQLKFLSAIVRKADVAAHYPGGCQAFESRHPIGGEDEYLYAIFSMSFCGIAAQIEAMKSDSFDPGRFVAIGDIWHGSIKQAEGIRFYVECWDTFPASWQAESDRGDSRD